MPLPLRSRVANYNFSGNMTGIYILCYLRLNLIKFKARSVIFGSVYYYENLNLDESTHYFTT